MTIIRAAADILYRAVFAALDFSGNNWRTLLFIVLVGAAGLFFELRRGEGVRASANAALLAVPPVFLAFCCVVAFHAVSIPWNAYQRQKASLASLRSDVAALTEALHLKRHSFDRMEPAYENAWGTTMAFWRWRQRLGESTPAKLLVTSDKEAAAFASTFTGYAVTGSYLGNGNLQNIGIPPQDTADIEAAASVDGTLVIHALPEVPGVLQLIDALAPLVRSVDRSFKMPPTPTELPSNVLWLHFGKGVRWSSEVQEEKRAERVAR